MRCLNFLEAIEHQLDDGFPKHLILKILGTCVSDSPPPTEYRKSILAQVWKEITSLNEPTTYINSAEAWIKFTVQHFNVCILIPYIL